MREYFDIFLSLVLLMVCCQRSVFLLNDAIFFFINLMNKSFAKVHEGIHVLVDIKLMPTQVIDIRGLLKY